MLLFVSLPSGRIVVICSIIAPTGSFVAPTCRFLSPTCTIFASTCVFVAPISLSSLPLRIVNSGGLFYFPSPFSFLILVSGWINGLMKTSSVGYLIIGIPEIILLPHTLTATLESTSIITKTSFTNLKITHIVLGIK